MSRQRKPNGVKLPFQLQQQLGLEVRLGKFGGKRRNGGAGTRKDKRRADRVQKKAARGGQTHNGLRRPVKEAREEDVETDVGSKDVGEDEGVDEETDHLVSASHPTTVAPSRKKTTILSPPLRPQSILKRPVPHLASLSDSEDSILSRASSPGLVLDSNSRSFKERAAQDDAEVATLEKKLGLKSNKLPKSFGDDGLDDLLEGLESEGEPMKRKREGDMWLARKRSKAAPSGLKMPVQQDEEVSDTLEDNDDELFGLDQEDFFSEGSRNESSVEDALLDEEVNSDDLSDSASDNEVLPATKTRENPYVAPVTSEKPVAKYIPPSMRQGDDQNSESLKRLRRQIQGHLNKLSEANLISILGELEKLYQSHARQDVTSTLVDMLVGRFCDPASLQSTFVNLHAGLVAALYKVIGTDFGAEFISKLVERLESHHNQSSPDSGKEAVNHASLLSHLFLFHVISSTLVVDYVRLFLERLNEMNTELILRVVRDCGPQLRQDDPASLKTIVQILQNSTAKLAADGKETSVRTKFMIETITDLKNNKIRTPTNSSGVASEHITRMRKVLGSLNNRNLRGSEPLRISRTDIQQSDKKGKWWLVSASWKGKGDADAAGHSEPQANMTTTVEIESEEADLLDLARQYGMNTDVRRSIFVAILSASDFQDAHLRITKLRLKRSQEQEIPRVILRCAAAETTYNPYYTLIAKKLCSEKKTRMGFQFALWDFFKKMGEQGEANSDDADDEESGQDVELNEVVNIAKMYGQLIVDGVLTICVLKVLNLAYLKDQAKMFVELLLIVILTPNTQTAKDQSGKKNIKSVFGEASAAPQIVNPLRYFLKKQVLSSDLVPKKEQIQIRKTCRTAIETLAMLSTPKLGSV